MSAKVTQMYDVLKRISKHYQTPDQLRRNSQKQYGLSYEEALEYAYENIQEEARTAIKGMRRPAEILARQPKGGAR